MRRTEVLVVLLVSYPNWLTCTGMACKSLIVKNRTELGGGGGGVLVMSIGPWVGQPKPSLM